MWNAANPANPTRNGTRILHDVQGYLVSAQVRAISMLTRLPMRRKLHIQSMSLKPWRTDRGFGTSTCRKRSIMIRASPPIGRLSHSLTISSQYKEDEAGGLDWKSIPSPGLDRQRVKLTKAQRQLVSAKTPPIGGPRASPSPRVPNTIAMYFPRSRTEVMSETMTFPKTLMPAPPNPCTARPPRNGTGQGGEK